MKRIHELLDELARETAAAQEAAHAGDAVRTATALDARGRVIELLSKALPKAPPAERRRAETTVRDAQAAHDELHGTLVALRDETRQALEATRHARAAAGTAALAQPEARFVSQRA